MIKLFAMAKIPKGNQLAHPLSNQVKTGRMAREYGFLYV